MIRNRFFITGAAGFIGFHLSLALKKLGAHVSGCDNFNDYYDPALKKERELLLKQADIEIIHLDINETEKITSYLKAQKPTHLIHLAAQAGCRYCFTHPEKYTESNIMGFLSIMEALSSMPHVHCLFASSSSVYGDNKKVPFSEEDRTDNPKNYYAVTKKTNELIAYNIHHTKGIPMTGLRFFTVYGPFGRPDMAYYSFTKNIYENKPIELFSGGLARDFTYIDDIVDGIIRAINRHNKGFEIFNLGNSHPEYVKDLIGIIEKLTGERAIIKEVPAPLAEVVTTYADISKSRELLGFNPTTSLEEGIRKFINWFQYHEKHLKDAL